MASPAPSRLERCGWRRDSISRPGRTFHPDYASNGFFFVYYNASVQPTQVTRLVRCQVSADPDLADPGSAQLVIEIDQPGVGHNGGWIGFGPDGYLVLPLGDGGAGGLPSQDIENLHGSALRLDVDGDDFPGDPVIDWTDAFAPPPGHGTIDEIVAFGEDAAGNLYIVDLGGEIFRVVPAGAVPAVPAPGFQVLMLLLAVAGLWQLAANRAR